MSLNTRRSTYLIGYFVCLCLCPGPWGCASGEHSIDAPTTSVMDGKDWRDEIIYQLMVDRFADGDVNNDWRVLYGALGRFQGGDWQGVIDHLDYLKALGVTALWISPVVKNVDYDAGFDSYHGYWAQDLEQVNPHFGTPGKLRELVDTAHQMGFRVILDIVTNHMSQLFYYDINGNGQPDEIISGDSSLDSIDQMAMLKRRDEYDPDFDPRGIQGWSSEGESGPAPIRFLYMPEINRVPPDPIQYGPNDTDILDFQRPGTYNRKGRVTNYDDQDQLLTGDFPGGLKDLDTTRDWVRAGLIKAYAHLIRDYDFDAFRIDTLKHVEHEFWQVFSPVIRQYVHGKKDLLGVPPLTVPKKNWFMFGEAFDGDDGLLGEFTYNGEIDSVFYFSQKFTVYEDVVKCSGPTSKAEQLWKDRATRLHGATRTCVMGGRCFRTTSGGPPTPDPAVGKPLYNQSPVQDGPVDAAGNGLAPTQLLVNFLDNHDVPRYLSSIAACPADPPNLSMDEALRRLHNALGLMFTQDGLPCVYYGTEQEYHGGNDPTNRERLFDTVLRNQWFGVNAAQRERMGDSGFDTSKKTFQWIALLARTRKAYAPLRRGDLKVVWSTDHTGTESDAGILAFTRTYDNKTILVVQNVSNTQTSQTTYMGNAMTTSLPAGTVLVDVLKDPAGDPTLESTYTVQAGGQVVARASPRTTRVLVPMADVVR